MAKLLNGRHGSKLVFALTQNCGKVAENGRGVGHCENFGRVAAQIGKVAKQKSQGRITFDAEASIPWRPSCRPVYQQQKSTAIH
jgi:hypothetical protein